MTRLDLRRRWFAAIYTRLLPGMVRSDHRYRERLLADLDGRVLELGCGPGTNFEFYPAGLAVVATDVSEHMLQRACPAAETAAAQIEVRQANVEALPFPDAAFDHVVSTLVLCSVDQRRVLAEVARVLRPGGSLRLWEHVRSDRRWVAWLQRAVGRPYGLVAGGCHLDRDTPAAIRAAGFEIEVSERIAVRGQPAHILAIARRPA